MPVYELRLKAVTKKGFPIEVIASPVGDESLLEVMEGLGSYIDGLHLTPPPVITSAPAGNTPLITPVPETKMCPIHNVPMTRRQKGNATWYSHKVTEPDGTERWCKGK